MKKNIVLVFLIALSIHLNAQSLIGGDQIIKTNLSADVLQNYNITYERSINHFMSISASFATMPKRSIPLKALAKQFIENSNIDFDNFKVSNNALTIESRFYLGLQKMSGFYIAPYARFGNMVLDIPINYQYNTQPTILNGVTVPSKTVKTNANLNGSIRSQSVGAYFGMQFQLLTKVVLDIWAIGGHYGSSNGKLIANLPAAIPTEAAVALKSTLDQTNANPFHLNTTISGNSVITNTDGPWLGLRGAGITIGFRF
jgi:hypothetical protein